MGLARVGEIRTLAVHEALLYLVRRDVVFRRELPLNAGGDNKAHGQAFLGTDP